MNKIDSLLERYRCVDEVERLHLFLSHRDHRGGFLKIDMAVGAAEVRPNRVSRFPGRWKAYFRRLCPGWPKS